MLFVEYLSLVDDNEDLILKHLMDAHRRHKAANPDAFTTLELMYAFFRVNREADRGLDQDISG